jgi:hypothetical protein
MSDTDQTNITNQSGGINVNAQRVDVGGNVVGRDKVLNAGRNIIVAESGATIAISESTSLPKPKLLIIAEQIRDCANASLFENERILFPVIEDPSTRYSAARTMARLFHEQRSRGDFGEWLAFLEMAQTKESNPDIRTTIEELLVAATQLHRAFYAYYESGDDEIAAMTKKQFLGVVLYGGEGSEWWKYLSDQEVVALVEGYLNFLRTATENTGRAVGKLNVLLS